MGLPPRALKAVYVVVVVVHSARAVLPELYVCMRWLAPCWCSCLMYSCRRWRDPFQNKGQNSRFMFSLACTQKESLTKVDVVVVLKSCKRSLKRWRSAVSQPLA